MEIMADSTTDRVFTPALLAFLVLVAGVLGWSLVTRQSSPDVEGCMELLADGDLDREERERILLLVMELAEQSSGRPRVAGWLAALSLQRRAAFAALGEGLDDALAATSAKPRWLHLGDPMLANVLRACRLGSDSKEEARVAWSQVAAQARMVANSLAAEHAQAALERLR